MEYDKENDRTELPEKIEEQLNEVGIFDSEIERFDNETIVKLEDAVSTEISVMYYSVDDKTGEKVEMSAEEIDETIAKNIEEGDIEYEDENNQNLITELYQHQER